MPQLLGAKHVELHNNAQEILEGFLLAGRDTDGATYLFCRRCIFRLLVVSDAQEAREPQGDAFFWVHLTGIQLHNHKVTAGQGCWLPGTGLDYFLYSK